VEAAWLVYVLGVGLGLVLTDASWGGRLGFSLAWPVALIACLVTNAVLLVVALIMFPIVGVTAVAIAVAVWLLA
jgi:hypothetical protein